MRHLNISIIIDKIAICSVKCHRIVRNAHDNFLKPVVKFSNGFLFPINSPNSPQIFHLLLQALNPQNT